MGRDAHVLEAKRFERLKAEDVANDRSREVGNRTFLEEVEVIGDIREPLTGRAGYRLDLVGLRSVVFTIGKTICPDYRPGSGGGFARDGRSCFLRIHAVLRRDAEDCEHVAVLRLIVRFPIPHLFVLQNARFITLLHVGNLDIDWLVHIRFLPECSVSDWWLRKVGQPT